MAVIAAEVLASGAGSEAIPLTGVAQTGDVLVVMATYPSGSTPGAGGPSDATGWTEQTNSADRPIIGTPGAARCTVWTKQYTGTPPASETFTNIVEGSVNRNITVAYAILRGVDYASIDIPSPVHTTAAQTQISHPATTVGGSSDGHVILFLSQSDPLTNVVAPSGFTIGENESGGAANTYQGYVMHRTDVAAGAAGPFVVQFDSNFRPKIGFTVSFANESDSPNVVPRFMNIYRRRRSV